MFFFDKAEITTDGTEDALLHALAAAMKARGFALLGVLAIRETHGALATLGEPSITERAHFKDILRSLADEIEIGEGRPADLTVPLA